MRDLSYDRAGLSRRERPGCRLRRPRGRVRWREEGPRQASNLQPSGQESGALPVELRSRDGRRGSRTPKPARAARFRDGVPRRWQSFQWAGRVGVASHEDVAGRNRTCGAPRFRRALYRLSYGHGHRAHRPPSISPRGKIDAVAYGRPSSVASVRSTALFSMPLAHPSTLDRRPPAAQARLVAVLRGGSLEPDPQSVLENCTTNTKPYLRVYFRANA